MRILFAIPFLLAPALLWAAPADIQAGYAAEAQKAGNFAAFSAQRGQRLFSTTHGQEWSCSSCHTTNPRQNGRHAVTGKTIAPLAPSANPERFTRPEKVEKWFRRNCRDVFARECTAQEKGDVMAYLLSLE
ncbi:MAG: hypothetical protein K0Q68_56 [Moraxellaceae bacterium]|jgi:mono/diheme cytochrome c family protein|nr:hypothetical protein [Moraxellaceae bacterium]